MDQSNQKNGFGTVHVFCLGGAPLSQDRRHVWRQDLRTKKTVNMPLKLSPMNFLTIPQERRANPVVTALIVKSASSCL